MLRASQAARGEDPGVVDALLAADEARRAAVTRFDDTRAEQKSLGKQVAQAQGEAKAALLDRAKELAAEVKALDEARAQADAELDALLLLPSNLVEDGAPRGGEDDYARHRGARRPARLRRRGLRPAGPRGDRPPARGHRRRARRQGVRLAVLLPHRGRRAARARARQPWRWRWPSANGFTPMIPPSLVRPAAMEGTGFLGQAAENVYRLEADDLYLVGTAEVPLAAYHMDEILDAATLPRRYAGVLAVLPPRGRLVRQGHPRHLPGALVRQGRDVRVRPPRRGRRRAPAAARRGRSSSSTPSSSPTASSTWPPATSARARPASTTARRGSRRRAATAR